MGFSFRRNENGRRFVGGVAGINPTSHTPTLTPSHSISDRSIGSIGGGHFVGTTPHSGTGDRELALQYATARKRTAYLPSLAADQPSSYYQLISYRSTTNMGISEVQAEQSVGRRCTVPSRYSWSWVTGTPPPSIPLAIRRQVCDGQNHSTTPTLGPRPLGNTQLYTLAHNPVLIQYVPIVTNTCKSVTLATLDGLPTTTRGYISREPISCS